jgi:hypothetical protein
MDGATEMSDLQFTDERPIELGVPREKIDELKRTLLNELSPEEIEAAKKGQWLRGIQLSDQPKNSDSATRQTETSTER